MSDLTRVDQWIRTTLAGDVFLSNAVGGRIYVDLAPQEAPLPIILFSFLGGADKTVTLTSKFTHSIYLIRAVGKGSSYDALEPLADRIHELLRVPTQGVLVRDVRITTVQREQPHQRKDLENGVPIVYLGGFYRIRYQPG